jgi:hypothetical protein
MTRQLVPRLILFWVFVVILIGAIIVMRHRTVSTKTSVIPASLARDCALASATDDKQVGGAVIPPTDVRGQVMTYGKAVQFIFGRPNSSDEGMAKIRDHLVWIVVLQGEFIEHVPASADSSIPAKDVIHSQMALLIDGNTGEMIERVMISPQKTLPVEVLPVLLPNSGTSLPLPTAGPIVTEAPFPTLSP